MAKLAFCGLGRMGEPMARRLLGSSDELVVWNRTPDKARGLVERGARQATSPAEAASGADAVFTMVSSAGALEEVVFGAGDGGEGGDGVAAGLAAGATLVEMSTVGPDAVRSMAERLPDGVGVLDAPVLGSIPQAEDGTLKVFAGGPDDVFERWRPVLERFGTPVHVGPLGAGAAMKLVANSTLGALMSALAEALALADALGLDQGLVLDVLSDSPIGRTAKSKRERIETGQYVPNFTLALAAKDMRLVTDAAEKGSVDAKLAAAARAHFQSAEAAGLGELDYSAVIAHVRGRPAGGGS